MVRWQQGEKVLVKNRFPPVGQFRKPVVDRVQVGPIEGISQLLEPVRNARRPECLPSTMRLVGTPTEAGVIISYVSG